MYTSKQCLEKLETCKTHEVLAWKFEYEQAIKREQSNATNAFDISEMLKALQSNSFARNNQPPKPKKIKAFDEIIELEASTQDESIDIADEVILPVKESVASQEDCPSCEIVAKRRGRKAKGSK